jgi:hypothetical protein
MGMRLAVIAETISAASHLRRAAAGNDAASLTGVFASVT